MWAAEAARVASGPCGCRCGSQARTAAETLPRSEVLEFPGLGHDVLQSSDCAPAVTVGFLENPAGGYHTSCLARVQMPAFTTG